METLNPLPYFDSFCTSASTTVEHHKIKVEYGKHIRNLNVKLVLFRYLYWNL